MSLTPDQLAVLLRDAKKAAPNPAGMEAAIAETEGRGADTDAASDGFEQEDTENE